MRRRSIALSAASLLAVPLAAGCMGSGPPLEVAELVTETETVPRDGVTELEVVIDLGIGAIDISGGAKSALDAEFTYNVPKWEPVFEHSTRGDVTSVTIRQPETKNGNVGDDVENSWSVRLPDDIPCALTLDIGVGESIIDLAGVHVTSITVDAGVGSVDLSLHGTRSDDLSVSIDGGVGELVVHVPRDLAVRVTGDTGIGAFRTNGLRSVDGYLVNDAYKAGGQAIDIKIDAGIGEIIVDTEERGTARA